VNAVEKLKEKVSEQELQIKQMAAILKATGNENLVSG
jgi:phosphoribosyl-dephospho-CoA transferase